MHIDLTGKTALVGGGTAGLGKAIAKELAACGAEVYLMARNEDKLKQVLAELDTTAGQVHGYIATDFMNFEVHKSNLKKFFDEHVIDILVNNTNGPSAGTVMNKSISDYQEAFDLLFKNAVYASSLALNSMRDAGFGRIINVSSLTVKEPQDSLVLSNTMRVALVSWSKSLSKAVAADGITVNSVLTGYFGTDRLHDLMNNQAKSEGVDVEVIEKRRIDSMPVKRLGKPEEYGYLVAFLASPYASFLTGASIPLDGGLSDFIF